MNQDERQFELEFGAVLQGLKDDRAPCPSAAELIAFHERELDAPQTEHIRGHAAACPACRELLSKLAAEPAPVDDLTWQRTRRSLDRRQWPWRRRALRRPGQWGLAAAALAAVALLAVWMLPDEPLPVPTGTRSAAPITVLAPAGRVAELEFRWQTAPIHHAYRVEIARGGEVLRSVTVEQPPLRADAELLAALDTGVAYRWRVRAVDPSGRILAESAWTGFQLAR